MAGDVNDHVLSFVRSRSFLIRLFYRMTPTASAAADAFSSGCEGLFVGRLVIRWAVNLQISPPALQVLHRNILWRTLGQTKADGYVRNGTDGPGLCRVAPVPRPGGSRPVRRRCRWWSSLGGNLCMWLPSPQRSKPSFAFTAGGLGSGVNRVIGVLAYVAVQALERLKPSFFLSVRTCRTALRRPS